MNFGQVDSMSDAVNGTLQQLPLNATSVIGYVTNSAMGTIQMPWNATNYGNWSASDMEINLRWTEPASLLTDFILITGAIMLVFASISARLVTRFKMRFQRHGAEFAIRLGHLENHVGLNERSRGTESV